jgi:CheY-like chemotaxis protein
VTRPRVLLVEDDASIRRFVDMALEDSGVDLVAAGTLAAAIDALRSGPYALVLCDLMLPDGSGFDLLHALADDGSPSPGARRVAFSAGVSAETRQRLLTLGVHEVLAKPVSVAGLLACVQAAVQPGPAAEPAVHERDADPVARFFGGDRGLFDAFAAQCRQQWRHDVATGDRAAEGADLPALRRLAHSVKSVLLTLGRPADSALARAVEDAAAEGRAEAAWALWPRLRERLLAPESPAATP